MARLQDFQTVTPTDSDNLLVVQATGQGLATVGSTLGSKMDKANPTGTGSLSLNKLSGSTLGTNAVAVGENCTASGNRSHAEGYGTKATALTAHSEGYEAEANGRMSHSEGFGTKANRKSQHVFGEYNSYESLSENTRGNYVEIVGNGQNDNSRSNARTLDWSGNEVLAGDLTINGNKSIKTELLDKTTSTVTANTTNVNSVAVNSLEKKNGMVQLDYVFNTKALTDMRNKSFATVPSGYRPSTAIYLPASLIPNYTTESKTMALLMQITATGDLRCVNNGAYAEIGTVTTNTQVYLHCCYFV